MSVYLARNFATVSKDLEAQLEQVKLLSQKTLEQEQEKIRIISEQNDMLEHKVEERTHELKEHAGANWFSRKSWPHWSTNRWYSTEIKNPLNFVTNFSELSGELLDELKAADNDAEKMRSLICCRTIFRRSTIMANGPTAL